MNSHEWLSVESQNGSNWSEKDLNVQMAPLMAPQKVPLFLCVSVSPPVDLHASLINPRTVFWGPFGPRST